MLRLLLSRLTLLALLLAAGFFQLAWELQHAALHREAGHEASEHSGPGAHSETPIESVAPPDVDLGHDHPAFQSTVTSARALAQAFTVRPAAMLAFRPASGMVVLATFALAPARASPTHERPTQPRAPPLA